MALDRIVVNVSGPLVVLSGLVCAVAPASLVEMAGIQASGNALTDVRAVYGGMQIGLGLFLLWCRADPARTTAGLLALGLAVASIGLIRLMGFLIDAPPDAFQLANLALEAVTSGLVFFALSRREAAPAV